MVFCLLACLNITTIQYQLTQTAVQIDCNFIIACACTWPFIKEHGKKLLDPHLLTIIIIEYLYTYVSVHTIFSLTGRPITTQLWTNIVTNTTIIIIYMFITFFSISQFFWFSHSSSHWKGNFTFSVCVICQIQHMLVVVITISWIWIGLLSLKPIHFNHVIVKLYESVDIKIILSP